LSLLAAKTQLRFTPFMFSFFTQVWQAGCLAEKPESRKATKPQSHKATKPQSHKATKPQSLKKAPLPKAAFTFRRLNYWPPPGGAPAFVLRAILGGSPAFRQGLGWRNFFGGFGTPPEAGGARQAPQGRCAVPASGGLCRSAGLWWLLGPLRPLSRQRPRPQPGGRPSQRQCGDPPGSCP
jgi:hypothetical protein